jgi:hypothetical protein
MECYLRSVRKRDFQPLHAKVGHGKSSQWMGYWLRYIGDNGRPEFSVALVSRVLLTGPGERDCARSSREWDSPQRGPPGGKRRQRRQSCKTESLSDAEYEMPAAKLQDTAHIRSATTLVVPETHGSEALFHGPCTQIYARHSTCV